MYFCDDEEDKTGASMTHTMFDDQQVSTFVGQWNCFPGPDGCIKINIVISKFIGKLCNHPWPLLLIVSAIHETTNLQRVIFNLDSRETY